MSTYRLTIDDDNTGRRDLVPDNMDDLDTVIYIFEALKEMVTAPGNKREGDAVTLLLTDEHGKVIRCYQRDANPPGMTGCELCGVGPDDECAMDCPSRYPG